jgi:hypothetical protein
VTRSCMASCWHTVVREAPDQDFAAAQRSVPASPQNDVRGLQICILNMQRMLDLNLYGTNGVKR